MPVLAVPVPILQGLGFPAAAGLVVSSAIVEEKEMFSAIVEGRQASTANVAEKTISTATVKEKAVPTVSKMTSTIHRSHLSGCGEATSVRPCALTPPKTMAVLLD